MVIMILVRRCYWIRMYMMIWIYIVLRVMSTIIWVRNLLRLILIRFRLYLYNMKRYIKKLLKENFGGKPVSVAYLTQLNKNVSHIASKKFLSSLVSRSGGSEMVDLSDREIMLLDLIKRNGKFDPRDFSSKN